jgi:hypothetical protein
VYHVTNSLNNSCVAEGAAFLLQSRLSAAAAMSRALLRRIGSALLRRSYSASAGSESGSAAAGYHVAGGPSYMRGAVFWEPGRPLTLEEFQMPRPKAGEVLVKTKGLAFPPSLLLPPLDLGGSGGFSSLCNSEEMSKWLGLALPHW